MSVEDLDRVTVELEGKRVVVRLANVLPFSAWPVAKEHKAAADALRAEADKLLAEWVVGKEVWVHVVDGGRGGAPPLVDVLRYRHHAGGDALPPWAGKAPFERAAWNGFHVNVLLVERGLTAYLANAPHRAAAGALPKVFTEAAGLARTSRAGFWAHDGLAAALADHAAAAAAAPATTRAADTFLSRARDALAAVRPRTAEDPTLKPLAAAPIEHPTQGHLEISVTTPERWEGFPNKRGAPQVGHGRISIRVYEAAEPHQRAWAPFVPPPGCHVGRTWLNAPGGTAAVCVYTQLGDRDAHGRLVALVREEFRRTGVALESE